MAGESDELTRQLRDALESPDPAVWNAASKSITGIFDTYLEQPYLLDPHLGGIVSPIMQHVRKSLRAWHAARIDEQEAVAAAGLGPAFACQVLHDPHLNSLLSIIYHACKTRGFKHIVKLMPHEVADLEPAVQALCSQDSSDHRSWETRYVLLLWLSILALVPFDLSSIDSGGASGGRGLIASLISVCKGYLSDPGPVRMLITEHTQFFRHFCASSPLQVRSAAALCLARLLSRPDMERRGGELGAFMEWAAATLAACTAPEQQQPQLVLGGGGAQMDLREVAEAPARPASIAAAAAAAAQLQADADVGVFDEGEVGHATAASRAFLAAGVMQVRVPCGEAVGRAASHAPASPAGPSRHIQAWPQIGAGRCGSRRRLRSRRRDFKRDRPTQPIRRRWG